MFVAGFLTFAFGSAAEVAPVSVGVFFINKALIIEAPPIGGSFIVYFSSGTGARVGRSLLKLIGA